MSNWTSHYIDTNGIKLHYTRSGGDKPPLVMSHGITDSGLCWTRLGRVLEADYDLIMVDARGHGLSDSPESGYTSENHVADLAGLIEGLDLGKPKLIGHSMGAGIIASLAANYPHLAGAIVLEDPPWRAGSDSNTPEHRQAMAQEWHNRIMARKELSPEALLAAGKRDNPKWDAVEYEAWIPAKAQVNPNVVELVSSPRNWSALIPKIECPALLMTADVAAGAIVSQETAEEVSSTNPNIQVAYIKDAGHNIRRENFQPYVEAVTAFLQSI